MRMCIQWPTFGPYHVVRLRCATEVLNAGGFEIIGLETASADITGRTQDKTEGSFRRETIFTGANLRDLTPRMIDANVGAALDRLQPDVVAINSYSYPDARACIRWCLDNRRGSVLMTDSRRADAKRTRWREWVKQSIVSQFGAALVAGSPHRRYVRELGLSDEKILCGYDVVDNDFFANGAQQARKQPESIRGLPGLDSENPFFLASGRMIARKDYATLIRAYGLYRMTSTNPWRLIILGDGDLRTEIEHTIKVSDIRGITLPGWQPYDRLPPYYGLAGAFVHPALIDQWGLVINEAMAAGLPVIVSDGSGCVEDLVRDKGTGFTFPAGDANRLAEFMKTVSSDGEIRAAMSARSKRVIGNWTPERFSNSLLKAALLAHESAHEGTLTSKTLLALLRVTSRKHTSFHSIKA